MDRKVVEVSSLSLSFSVYLPTCLPLYVRVYLLISLSLFHLLTYLSIYLSVYLSIWPELHLSDHELSDCEFCTSDAAGVHSCHPDLSDAAIWRVVGLSSII